jgi:hypothetical protein
MTEIFGKRHLVCDGPLNGSYVEAGIGPDLEPRMVDDYANEYEIGRWPTGEWVWLHNGVMVALFPGAQEPELEAAVAEAWEAAYGKPEYPLATLIRDAVNDCEVR